MSIEVFDVAARSKTGDGCQRQLIAQPDRIDTFLRIFNHRILNCCDAINFDQVNQIEVISDSTFEHIRLLRAIQHVGAFISDNDVAAVVAGSRYRAAGQDQILDICIQGTGHR